MRGPTNHHNPMSHPDSVSCASDPPGIGLDPPELLLVRRGRRSMAVREAWLDALAWRVRECYSLDHALDLLKQHTPSVVLVDQMPSNQWSSDLLGWLESVCALLPVIMVHDDMDPDQEACLRGIGVFQMVGRQDLTAQHLSRLLEDALAWGLKTGRWRQPTPWSLMVMEWDMAGRLTGLSGPLAHALGWPCQALIGADLGKVVAPASLTLRDRWMRSGTQRLQMLRQDGSTWPAAVVRQAVLGADGEPVRILGEFRSLGTRRGLDGWGQKRVMLVAQKLKAERASLAKSRFMAAMSHDLRQPMHAMGLFIEELRRTLPQSPQLSVIDSLSMSLDSMSSLLDSVLTLSRLEADQWVPDRVPFSIEPMLIRLRTAHRVAAREKGLRLEVASCSAQVLSDPTLLERTLGNLMANAVQYTVRGGVLLTCRLRGDRLRVQVWDTGVGIPPEEQEAVFQAFHRVEHEQAPHDGVGLGLSIVRSCAAVLGLQLGLRSVVGRGSCFRVDIPLAQADAVSGPPAPLALMSLTPLSPKAPPVPIVEEPCTWLPQGSLALTVLILDPDGSGGQALRPLLEGWGCRVVQARTLRAARLSIGPGEQRPHLLIGVLSGEDDLPVWSSLQAIRLSGPSVLPAIVITTDSSLHAARQARLQRVTLMNRPVPPARLHGLMASLGRRL